MMMGVQLISHKIIFLNAISVPERVYEMYLLTVRKPMEFL